jgi:hypothetical protein
LNSNTLWDAPDPTDAPATEEGSAPRPTTPVRLGGISRGVITAMLAGGLLVIGGVAAVAAADPSSSPGPSATEQPADPGSSATPADSGSGPGHRGPCPEKDGSGGSGSDGSQTSPDASPNADGSDV